MADCAGTTTLCTTLMSLREIASWQIPGVVASEPKIVAALPALQRGAVWKPFQTEALWDSLARSFPIGAMLLAPYDKERGVQSARFDQPNLWSARYHLLDGQQRATAIALGFLNPWTAEKEPPAVLWVDLAEPQDGSDLSFLFRVVTRAHPWGYKKTNPQDPLSASAKRQAFASYLGASALLPTQTRLGDLPLTDVWPWDAEAPIPVPLLIEALAGPRASRAGGLGAISLEGHPEPPNTGTTGETPGRTGDFNDYEPAQCLLGLLKQQLPNWKIDEIPWQKNVLEALEGRNQDLSHRFLELANSVGNLLADIGGYRIPVQILPPIPKTSQTDSDSETKDPVETLFVRVNRLGTELAGEQLMYSMLKSAWPEAPKYITKIQHKLALPSRLVLLSARLVLVKSGEKRPPPIPNVNRFRRLIYGSDTAAPDFLKELEAFVRVGGAQVFDRAKTLLTAGAYALPPVLATDLAQKSPATFFLLLRWIHRMDAQGIDTTRLNEDKRRKLLGFITALGWFATSAEKAVENIWPALECATAGDLEGFFCRKNFDDVIKLGERGGIKMLPLVRPDLLQSAIEGAVTAGSGRAAGFNDPEDKFWQEWRLWDNLSGYIGEDLRNWFTSCLGDTWQQTVNLDGDKIDLTVIYRDAWTRFLNNLWGNRNLLLYAQRKWLATWFPDYDPSDPDQVEDKNRPWDFDHVHPQRYLVSDRGSSFWNIPIIIKDWHRTIGNLRAWPMEANRSDSDDAPAIKLGDVSDVERSYGMHDTSEVREASFIRDSDWNYWKACVPSADSAPRQYLGDNKNYGQYRKLLLQAITTRFVAVYKEWYDELRIEDLMPNCNHGITHRNNVNP